MRRALVALACAAAALLPGPGAAQEVAPLPFPVALGGPFTLTDQHGAPRGAAAPPGTDLQLLFFGYANCAAICSVALPLMAEIVDRLGAAGVRAVPVMVTVDPTRDTVAKIGPPLRAHHPDFVGLTGTPADVSGVHRLFGVEAEVLFHEPDGAPVYAHGSHVYLLDASGAVLTLVPPILSAQRIAEIALARLPG